MKIRTAILVIAMAAALAVAPSSAEAASPIDLLDSANVRIDGAADNDQAAFAVSGIGDVNDDGRPDIAVGTPLAGNNGRVLSGSVYVVFGHESLADIDLNDPLGADGYRIDGGAVTDYAGFSVDGAGDVNGDGIDDIAIGAAFARYNNRPQAGSVFVVFGRAAATDIDLSSAAYGGFRIDGAGIFDHAGISVAGAGDVNGDQLADVVLGAYGADSAYVVFGKATTTDIDLTSLRSQGYRIAGSAHESLVGFSVGGGSDFDGDGYSDVIVGAPTADRNGRTTSGTAHVVFGKATSGTVDLGALGSSGFHIDGEQAGDTLGTSVAMIGDVNGDGLSDAAVGAPGTDHNARENAGSAYIVFGRAGGGELDLAALGADGTRIDGEFADDRLGSAVAAAGDINGDVRPDLILGASNASNNGRAISGSGYVVHSSPVAATLDLATLGSGGYRIDGAAENDYASAAVSGPGDVDGDSQDDILVGAPNADSHGRVDPGAAYIAKRPVDPPPTDPPGTEPPAATPPTEQSAEPSSETNGTVERGCSRLTSFPALSSVSRWKRLRRGGRARVRGPVGGLVVASSHSRAMKVRLFTKQTTSRNSKLSRAVFYLDAKRVATDARRPLSLDIPASRVVTGSHLLKSKVFQGRRATVLTYRFLVAQCKPARFSVAMSSKKPGARPSSLKFTAATNGPQLKSASFVLPSALVVKAPVVRRGDLGVVRLVMGNGTRRAIRLRAAKAASPGGMVLSGADSASVALRIRRGARLDVTGLPQGVTGLSVKLLGRKTGLVRNPARCSKLNYRATLADRAGASLTLASKATVC